MDRFDPNTVLASCYQEYCNAADALLEALERYQSAGSGYMHVLKYIAYSPDCRTADAIRLEYTDDGHVACLPPDYLDVMDARKQAVRAALQRVLNGQPAREAQEDDDDESD